MVFQWFFNVLHDLPMVFLRFFLWFLRSSPGGAWWHQEAFHAIRDGLRDGVNLASAVPWWTRGGEWLGNSSGYDYGFILLQNHRKMVI